MDCFLTLGVTRALFVYLDFTHGVFSPLTNNTSLDWWEHLQDIVVIPMVSSVFLVPFKPLKNRVLFYHGVFNDQRYPKICV